MTMFRKKITEEFILKNAKSMDYNTVVGYCLELDEDVNKIKFLINAVCKFLDKSVLDQKLMIVLNPNIQDQLFNKLSEVSKEPGNTQDENEISNISNQVNYIDIILENVRDANFPIVKKLVSSNLIFGDLDVTKLMYGLSENTSSLIQNIIGKKIIIDGLKYVVGSKNSEWKKYFESNNKIKYFLMKKFRMIYNHRYLEYLTEDFCIIDKIDKKGRLFDIVIKCD